MTEMTHPITPPLELVQQWEKEAVRERDYNAHLATRAAQWGADQELEACCEWLKSEGHEYEHEALLASRRPKPPSLKKHALETLSGMQIEPCIINGINVNAELQAKYDVIRRALEQLDD